MNVRKKPISPKTSMKPLYWTRIQVPVSIPESKSEDKITAKVQDAVDGAVTADADAGSKQQQSSSKSVIQKKSPSSCLWEKIDEDDEVQKTFIQKFADLFSRQPIKKKEKEKKESPKKAKQVSVRSLFSLSTITLLSIY